MNDPLDNFNWKTLHKEYDNRCINYNRNSPFLRYFKSKPSSDRELYYYIIDSMKKLNLQQDGMPVDLYLAIMYWKLYSQPAAVANICTYILENETQYNEININLYKYLIKTPKSITRDISIILSLLNNFDEYRIRGITSQDALPVRTTLLHFIYPDVVPIFDKMVLQAVGIFSPDANKDIKILKKYLPHSWQLSEKYKNEFDSGETSLRKIDMALWVHRGDSSIVKKIFNSIVETEKSDEHKLKSTQIIGEKEMRINDRYSELKKLIQNRTDSGSYSGLSNGAIILYEIMSKHKGSLDRNTIKKHASNRICLENVPPTDYCYNKVNLNDNSNKFLIQNSDGTFSFKDFNWKPESSIEVTWKPKGGFEQIVGSYDFSGFHWR